MKNTILIILILITVYGCELIVIGNPNQTPKIIEINQKSPVGAVYLFKTELDSNNIPAATQILAAENGSFYLAYEKYEMYYDIDRLRRIISKKPITNINIDTVAKNQQKFNFEFDYLQNMTFTTKKINDEWYIIDISNWGKFTDNQVEIKRNKL